MRPIRVAMLAIALLAPILASAEPDASPPIRLDNEFEIADAIVAAILKSRRVVDGTAFVGVRVAADGTVTPGDAYGTPISDPQLAALIRDVTARIQFLPDGRWESAHPDRLWAVFWMFQTNGCEPKIYTPPADVTAIRVCLRIAGGKAKDEYAVLFEGNPPLVQVPPREDASPHPVFGSVRPEAYPLDAREAGKQGQVILRGILGANGRMAKTEVLADTAGPKFRATVASIVRQLTYAAGGAPVEGREVYLRIDFRLAMVDGRNCVEARIPFPQDYITICGSRIRVR